MRSLYFFACLCLLGAWAKCSEESKEPEPVADSGAEQTPTAGEEPKEPAETGADDLENPTLDMGQLEEMNKMMKVLTGMQCLMSMDKHLKSNAEHLTGLKTLDNPQTRMDRLILNMYDRCKNSKDGLTGIADMLGGKQGADPSDVGKIYEGLDIAAILADDTPELSADETALLEEFKEVEQEMRKYQEEAKKQAQSETKAKAKSGAKGPKKAPKRKAPKKKGSANYWGLFSVVVIGGLLYFLLSRLFRESEVQPKKKKKKEKKK